MASVIKIKRDKGMVYFIQLSDGENAQRPKFSLGRCGYKDAQTACNHIENLLKANRTGGELATSTQEWLNKIPDSLRVRLERLGLVEVRSGSRWTVAAFVADYIKKRTDVKPATRRKWEDVESRLNAFFRSDTIADVTVQQAKSFRVYLESVVGLAENSLRRHIGIARQFFNSAIDSELITKNPFRDQPVSVRANDARFFYVTPAIAQTVLDACPDAQWRLIFGLARFGGLRCPSEVLRLKWQDVDFDKQRFTVHASKTKRHADGGIRIVPMFPELKPLFQDAFDEAKDGAVYCLDRYNGQWSNLGVHMARIIKRTGIKPWKKLFQNCRSTRETELFKITGGNVKAVCSWIGNSPAVAMMHYAQVTEADMKEAATRSVLNDAEETVQNRVQTNADNEFNAVTDEKNDNDVTPDSCLNLHQLAGSCADSQNPTQWAIQDLNL